MPRTQLLVSLFLLSALAACGGDSGDSDSSDSDLPLADADNTLFPVYQTPAGITECSSDDIKQRVDWDMHDYYIYADQSPFLTLEAYDSPEELMADLRVDPDIYSGIQETSTFESFLGEGIREDFGIWFSFIEADAVRFRQIMPGSSADRVGILRGDEVIALNGVPIEQLTAVEVNDEILTPENAPVSFTIRTGEEDPRTVAVNYEAYQWITAGPSSKFLPRDGLDLPVVGYLPVRSFLGTTTGEMSAAIADLRMGDPIGELIVDLRYNRGGLTNVATLLASMVGGEAVGGEVAYVNMWNDKYGSLNESVLFDTVSQPLNMSRVIVLTTEQSASSSEIFINALKPYIDVVVVGATTSGKPFSSRGQNYCGQTISAMQILRENSVGVSVIGGIAPDCAVLDNWQTREDSVEDPLTRGALDFVQSGLCPDSATIASSSERSRAKLAAPYAGIEFEPADPINFAVDN